MSLISVIVPVYKVEKYLDRCIDSIVNQTFKDIEIILIDDGSPDNCSKMCDEWGERDSRIVVIHQENQGLSAARNSGIRIAKGDYFTFVDSDDWISPTMISDLYEIINKHDADISICNFIRTDRKMNKEDSEDSKELVYSQEEFMKLIMRINGNRCIHYAWGKLYKRKVIDFDEHYPVGMLNEDVEGMFKAVIQSQKIVETNKIGYYYFNNTESISRTKFGINFLSLHEVWNRILSLAESRAPQYYDYVKYNYIRSDFTILMDYILYGDEQTDIKYNDEKEIILKRLKNNIWILFKSPMKMNRKIMLIFIAYFFNPFKMIVRVINNKRKY
ncbi:glycosyltransferase [Ruminococcus sp. HUN007]|uniref:glycosyltransferase family 2 protein n=1 Tax=Ruminococcus sp. HUN007 TaxID=1514668 RepID=UPI000678F07B|nr:glycosyltransferase [Ruminococcus sp. HUN007]